MSRSKVKIRVFLTKDCDQLVYCEIKLLFYILQNEIKYNRMQYIRLIACCKDKYFLKKFLLCVSVFDLVLNVFL